MGRPRKTVEPIEVMPEGKRSKKRPEKVELTTVDKSLFKDADFSTKLIGRNRTILIKYKDYELTVHSIDESGKTKLEEKTKYNLGDVGAHKYCNCKRYYQSIGYNIEAELSNMDDILKKSKRKSHEKEESV